MTLSDKRINGWDYGMDIDDVYLGIDVKQAVKECYKKSQICLTERFEDGDVVEPVITIRDLKKIFGPKLT